LKTNPGKGNFIFVGSSNDLFAASIPAEWVFETLDHCDRFDNKYLFQSKNPLGFTRLVVHPVAKKSVICTTLESNRFYPEFMGFTLHLDVRTVVIVLAEIMLHLYEMPVSCSSTYMPEKNSASKKELTENGLHNRTATV
jgi:hypothetical protein